MATKNLVSMSDEELRKLASQNSEEWKTSDNETQKTLHEENLKINSILDQRNNTDTTYDGKTGTYKTSPGSANNTYASPSSYYDADSDTAYQKAISQLQSVNSEAPVYKSSYDTQLKDLYEQIVNRDKFSYDINEDALYQQYAQQYAQNGKKAMEDTIGQTAALTGGYGSTYSQNAGQQQYDAYMQKLNEIIPTLYSQAYSEYQDDGNQLLTQYSILSDLANDEYTKYQNQYNQWLNDRNYAQDMADEAYSRGYTNWQDSVNNYNTAYNRKIAEEETEYNRRMAEEALAYDRQNDAYNRMLTESSLAYDRQNDAYTKLKNNIVNYGYIPSAEELNNAGMSENEALIFQNAYIQNNTGTEEESNIDFDGLFEAALQSGNPKSWLKQKSNYSEYGLTTAPSYSDYENWLSEYYSNNYHEVLTTLKGMESRGERTAQILAALRTAKEFLSEEDYQRIYNMFH